MAKKDEKKVKNVGATADAPEAGLPTDDVEESADVEEADETEDDSDEDDAPVAKKLKPKIPYTKKEKQMVLDLIDGGVELKGDETAELLQTLWDELQGETRNVTEAEVIKGVPNTLPPRFEPLTVNGKVVNFPVFFVTEVADGFALYNERGQRVSQRTSDANEVGQLNKAAARANALRRANRLPEEMQS